MIKHERVRHGCRRVHRHATIASMRGVPGRVQISGGGTPMPPPGWRVPDLGSAPAVTLENGLAAEYKWLADYL